MASASLLPSSSPARRWKHDVFLSFRGPDPRKGITSELLRLLTMRGIETFMDDRDIEVGNIISRTIGEAIEESKFAIIILSPNYASSTWCLQELTKICQCMEYNNRILPLFFNVEPTHVRFQGGSFEEAFTNYENSGLYRSEKLQEWKDALTKVANFSGWESKKYKTDRELVKTIVEAMYSKVQPIGNNKRDHEATREAKNKAQVALGVNVFGGYISGGNVNLGKQGDVIKNVGGDFIKGVHGDFIKGGPNSNIIRGDRGGDGGNSHNGGFAGVGGPANGNNTFNYDHE